MSRYVSSLLAASISRRHAQAQLPKPTPAPVHPKAPPTASVAIQGLPRLTKSVLEKPKPEHNSLMDDDGLDDILAGIDEPVAATTPGLERTKAFVQQFAFRPQVRLFLKQGIVLGVDLALQSAPEPSREPAPPAFEPKRSKPAPSAPMKPPSERPAPKLPPHLSLETLINLAVPDFTVTPFALPPARPRRPPEPQPSMSLDRLPLRQAPIRSMQLSNTSTILDAPGRVEGGSAVRAAPQWSMHSAPRPQYGFQDFFGAQGGLKYF
jgi:hypothetical protein